MKLVNVPQLDSESECTINVDQVRMLKPEEKYGREVTRVVFSEDHVIHIDWPHAQTVEALQR
jgi:hypothetical protein